MKFRFKATTAEGHPRSGFIEVPDEAAGRSQLARRGLTIESLDLVVEAPVPEESGEVTRRLPDMSHLADMARHIEPRQRLIQARNFLKRLDWKRVGPALGLLVGLLWLISLGLGRVLADRTFHIQIFGEVHLATKRRVTRDYLKLITFTVVLPESGFAVHKDGSMWVRRDKKWLPIRRRAQADFKLLEEGRFSLDVQVALPDNPKHCTVFVMAPGFKPSMRRADFKYKNNIFEAQLSDAVLHRKKK